MKKFIILYPIIGIIIFCNCSGKKILQKNLNAVSYSLSKNVDYYFYDQDSNSIKIDTVYYNSNLLQKTTTVEKQKGYVLPFIIVNFWNVQFVCTQGKSMIIDDIPLFLKNSLLDDISTMEILKEKRISYNDYSVELSIDEISTVGVYRSSGKIFYFIVFAYNIFSDKAGPAISKLKISYKLKKEGAVVLSKTYSVESIAEAEMIPGAKILQYSYAKEMVNAVSKNFNQINRYIINDLNTYFANQIK